MNINIIEFIKQKQTLSSKLKIEELERAVNLFDVINGTIDFTLHGNISSTNRTILILSICGKIMTLCQNCLNSMELDINCNLTIPVFSSKEEFESALLTKDNAECDGVVAETQFDVLNFIEDEIIMQLPIAPKHGNCPKIG